MIKERFNDNWEFRYGTGNSFEFLTGGAAKPQKVQLPHDASICLPRSADDVTGSSGNGYFVEKNCVYTKNFEIEEEYSDQCVWLEFEGVYQNAVVYINNAFAGKCAYGYSNFYIDATKFIRFGQNNTIKVVVKNEVPSGRWYTGGGIYRDVNIMIGDRIHIIPDGVRIGLAEYDGNLAALDVDVDTAHTGLGTRTLHLLTELVDANGTVVSTEKTKFTAFEGDEKTYHQRLFVKNPQLWDEDHPYLYSYRVFLLDGEEELDREFGSYGIRQMQLDPVNGLRINGRTVKLRGGCLHHDTGITGTAEFPHEEEVRVKNLKEAGFNAIRSSHYPMSRVLLDACDKYGMYVMDEFADVWTSTKVAFDYGLHMTEWWEHDITNLVRKDYNHPCVIMYSIGNEIPENGNAIDVQWGKKFADRLKELDPTRYTTNSLNLMLAVMDRLPEIVMSALPEEQKNAILAKGEDALSGEINEMMSNLGSMMDLINGSSMIAEIMEEASSQVDITGYNYALVRYQRDKELFPNRILVGSETYPKDLDVNWEAVESMPNVIGDFDWTCYDYLGEAGIGKIRYGDDPEAGSFYASYPTKAAYCGDINLIGDRRPVSYWREIIWGLREAPYLAVQPPKHFGVEKKMSEWCTTDAVRSWNWSGYEGKGITVEVYTDADEAELFVNGESKGRKSVGETKKDIALFDVTYEPGELFVIVYSNGYAVGDDTIKTASDNVQIKAELDVENIPADGSDVGYVEISLVDENGLLNPEVVKQVEISVEGPAAVIGYGSADPDSEENYFDTTARTFEGRLRAAVRGVGQPGVAKVQLTAEGCEPYNLEISVNE